MYKTNCGNCGDRKCGSAGRNIVGLFDPCAGRETLAMLALNNTPQAVHDLLEKYNLPFTYHKGDK